MATGRTGPTPPAGLADRPIGTDIPARTGAAPTRTSTALPIVTLAALVGLVTMLRHEWWRDEAFPWLLVRESRSVGEMLAAIHDVGHPWLYYLLVYGLHRIAPSPLALSLTNLLVAVLAIALFVQAAPFTRVQKLMFALGYFPLYQYGVISRSYSLLLAVLFGYAWTRTRHPDRVGTRLLLLALLTQVHVIGAIAAVGLTAWELLGCRQWRRAAWLGVASVVVGLAATAWQIAGSASHAYSSPATSLVRALANGFVPDYARLRDQPRQRLAGFGLWVLAVAALLADRSWRAVLLYSGLAAGLAALCLLVYPGYRWHHGWFFLFYLLALWIAPGRRRFSSPVVSLLLAVQTLIGAYAVYDDFVHPYSNGAAAAAVLRERGLANLPLIAVSVRPDDFTWNLDEAQPVLVELPGQRLYDPNAGAFVPYYTHFYVGYFGLIDRREMLAELAALSTRLRSPVAVIAVLHGGRAEPPAPLRLVAELPPARDFGEHLAVWLYEAEPPR